MDIISEWSMRDRVYECMIVGIYVLRKWTMICTMLTIVVLYCTM